MKATKGLVVSVFCLSFFPTAIAAAAEGEPAEREVVSAWFRSQLPPALMQLNDNFAFLATNNPTSESIETFYRDQRITMALVALALDPSFGFDQRELVSMLIDAREILLGQLQGLQRHQYTMLPVANLDQSLSQWIALADSSQRETASRQLWRLTFSAGPYHLESDQLPRTKALEKVKTLTRFLGAVAFYFESPLPTPLLQARWGEQLAAIQAELASVMKEALLAGCPGPAVVEAVREAQGQSWPAEERGPQPTLQPLLATVEMAEQQGFEPAVYQLTLVAKPLGAVPTTKKFRTLGAAARAGGKFTVRSIWQQRLQEGRISEETTPVDLYRKLMHAILAGYERHETATPEIKQLEELMSLIRSSFIAEVQRRGLNPQEADKAWRIVCLHLKTVSNLDQPPEHVVDSNVQLMTIFERHGQLPIAKLLAQDANRLPWWQRFWGSWPLARRSGR